MTFLIIGNIISCIGAIFTGLSSWARKREKIYLYQTYQCLLLALASVFFQSWTGIATLLLCALRNILTAKQKLTLRISVIMIIALVFISIFINNRGTVGWIVTIATVIYTIGAYAFKSEFWIKINCLVNLVLWIIYDTLIWDFSSLIMDSIVLVVLFIAIIRIIREKNNIQPNA